MIEVWKYSYLRGLLLILLFFVFSGDCSSLNHEGLALLKFRERIVSDPFGALANWIDGVLEMNPCSWNGIECSDSNVVSLNLGDMCLKGTLGPELAKLTHIKSIILRNNLFCGIIPVEITNLKELETLDLGYNRFTGPVPCDILSILSLSILLLDNNRWVNCVSPEICELQMLSEAQTDEKVLSRNSKKSCDENLFPGTISLSGDVSQRRLLQMPENVETFLPPIAPPTESPSPSPSQPPFDSPSPTPSISPEDLFPPIAPSNSTPAEIPDGLDRSSNSREHRSLIIYTTLGSVAMFLILVTGIIFWQSSNLAVVKPWATGLSGQLQRAFITGVPKLKRSELETACEDFSNVIGSSVGGTLYKGTLSSGIEIAVMSFSVSTVKDWSNDLERQFREKIQMLSKMNHKNFVNLLGYCNEEEPFTRMMVFEYAPNGTLFEHLHIKEAEHLDWTTRMRIIMGMAYCLEYMHEMTPPISLKNLNSKAIYLTEDYAAKVSDFSMLGDATATSSTDMEASPASNVCCFGVMLFEIVTGKLPYTVENSVLTDWASDFLNGNRSITEMADPILNSFEVQQLERISEVIRSCVNPDPKRRPEMKEVSLKLRDITSVGPDTAIPRLSPLWWAELEVLSAESG